MYIIHFYHNNKIIIYKKQFTQNLTFNFVTKFLKVYLLSYHGIQRDATNIILFTEQLLIFLSMHCGWYFKKYKFKGERIQSRILYIRPSAESVYQYSAHHYFNYILPQYQSSILHIYCTDRFRRAYFQHRTSSAEGYGLLVIRSIVLCGWQHINSGMINDHRDLYEELFESDKTWPGCLSMASK